ncbi:MAG TPA: aminomethyltransferase family protein [Acidimicrobiia bacterium]|nr:aminomethyltransferase family protein [Acidimicrobiia bacterium]
MIKETPFHPRTSALNETGLWSHWSGYLATDRYQMSDKFEYFAIRNSAAVIDTSPLYKYRIYGKDAEKYLAGVLTRDIRKCRPGQAHYTAWSDDDGWVIEDGVILRLSDDEFLLTAAEPNLAYLQGLTSGMSVAIEDVSDEYGALALQGPYSREILKQLAPEMEGIGYFHLTPAKIGNAAVTISRTGYTGDLGYEIWVKADDALDLWDRLFEVAAPYGTQPAGQTALLITRIEAGLILIDVDFYSARYAWNDEQRATALELNMGWMLRDLASDDRPFIGRKAIEREIAEKTSRWRTVGIVVDWQHWAKVHNDRGLITPKDHTPEHGGMMIYNDKLERIGYTPSFVYSPILQRHIGITRIRPEYAEVGTKVSLEVTIDHIYDVVDSYMTRLPFYNPPRKTA